MYIIEVIPLATLPSQAPQLLSYFFERPLVRGAVIRVPLGSRLIKAVVIASSTLESQKISLKKSLFQLKKAAEVISEEPCINSLQLKIAAWLAAYYYAPLALCLKTVLPPFFQTKRYAMPVRDPLLPLQPPPEPLVITVSAGETIAQILPHIRAGLLRGHVVLLVPERAVLDFFVHALAEFDPIVIHSQLSGAECAAAYRKLQDDPPRLIVGTRMALFAPFRCLGAIIVEDYLNEAYKSDSTPKYRTPETARHIAEIYGARLIQMSSLLGVAEYHALGAPQASHANAVGSPCQSAITVVDLTQEIRTGSTSLFSRPLERALSEALTRKKRVLLYSSRRAYSTIVVCRNCGGLARCKNCDIPLRVHKTSERMLICYHCAAYHQFPDACGNCRSTALTPSGIPGSQKIQEEAERLMERHHVRDIESFILDSDLVRDTASERALMAGINASPCPLVIATHMIASHRYGQRFDLIGIVNTDALATSNDFRTDERLAYQLAQLRDCEPAAMIVQTNNPSGAALALGLSGNQEFYAKELDARKRFDYPPFSRLVKIGFKHADQRAAAYQARVVSEKLKMAVLRLGLGDAITMLGPSPASVAKEDNLYNQYIILKIGYSVDNLETILKYIPSGWSIDPDPQSLV